MYLLKRVVFCALLFSGFFTCAFAVDEKVIYGEDNRRDLKDVTKPLYIDWARSTAAMMDERVFKKNQDGTFTILYGTLLEKKKVCPEVRFAEQLMAADCTGFLVSDDLLVTAGHCVRKQKDCEKKKWVFDYSIDSNESDYSIVSPENIYQCLEIISRVEDDKTENDYALIRLNRPVMNRAPLSYRQEGKISVGSHLVLIGHPSGLPVKVADGAFVRENSKENFFTSNVDSFGGNSGSPVINAQTGNVEGILVRGDDDYVMDKNRNCRQPKRCTMKGCRGEDATRITNLSELINDSKHSLF